MKFFNYVEINGDPRERASFVFKLILVIYICLAGLSIRVLPIGEGGDLSWVYALNYFVDKKIIFGKDVFFTFGPLGFLTYTMDVGSTLFKGISFQLFISFVFSALIIYLSFVKKIFSTLHLFLFALLFSQGRFIFHSFDYFVCLLVLLFLSLSFYTKRWYLPFLAALVLSVLLLFVKFVSGLIGIVSMSSFILVIFFIDRKQAYNALILSMVGIPFLFISSYFLYNPSFPDMFSYVKGAVEISSGYNVAMSVPGRNIDLVMVFFVILLYGILMHILYRRGEKSFLLSLIFLLPLFVAFKHGFVRQDLHILSFFSFALLIFGLVVLFTNLTKDVRGGILFIVLSLLSIWVYVYSSHLNPQFLLKQTFGFPKVAEVFNLTTIKEDLAKSSEQYLQSTKLPQDLGRKIGSHKVGIFPWEVSYVAANDLNYTPFPVFQTYSAYTSYLDMLNAGFLEDQNRAPEYILTEWKAIDGRHPLADVPGMWLSMYKWYGGEGIWGKILLLKRKATPRFTSIKLLKKEEYRALENIKIPVSTHPIVAKIYLDLKPVGKIFKLGFRIPEVKMELLTKNGEKTRFRIVPNTLQDGLLINLFPKNLKDLEALLRDQQLRDKMREFKLLGKGIKFYEPTIRVEFYEINQD